MTKLERILTTGFIDDIFTELVKGKISKKEFNRINRLAYYCGYYGRVDSENAEIKYGYVQRAAAYGKMI